MTDPVDLDLDRLDALHAAATPGYSGAFGDKGLRYRMRDGVNEVSGCDSDGLATFIADFSAREDAKLYIALHNAWPAISAELRRLRARVQEYEDVLCALGLHPDTELAVTLAHIESVRREARNSAEQGDDDGN